LLVLAEVVVVLELDAVSVTVTEVLDPLFMMQQVLLLLHDGAKSKSMVGLGRRLRLLPGDGNFLVFSILIHCV
jgi:hypothetical protein